MGTFEKFPLHYNKCLKYSKLLILKYARQGLFCISKHIPNKIITRNIEDVFFLLALTERSNFPARAFDFSIASASGSKHQSFSLQAKNFSFPVPLRFYKVCCQTFSNELVIVCQSAQSHLKMGRIQLHTEQLTMYGSGRIRVDTSYAQPRKNSILPWYLVIATDPFSANRNFGANL